VPEFPLNGPQAAGAQILVAGENFGCGSSREHAVWALQDAGFRAVVSVRFADIFRANALANGLLPIEVSAAVVTGLAGGAAETRDERPETSAAELVVDLEAGTLARGREVIATFSVPPFSRYCLLNGIDELEFLMGAGPEIDVFERDYTPRVSTVVP
jgi:3-isopropylmalate/(R)-2-methylmalate dehydratase small subunit